MHLQSWLAAGGTPGECLLTGWMVDNGISPSVLVRWDTHQPTLLDMSLNKVSIPVQHPPSTHAPTAFTPDMTPKEAQLFQEEEMDEARRHAEAEKRSRAEQAGGTALR